MKKKIISVTVLFFILTPLIIAKPHKVGENCSQECCQESRSFAEEGHTSKIFNPEKMQRILSLSKEQIEKIRKINEEYRQKGTALRSEMKPQHEKLKEELMAEDVNLEKVRSIMKSSSDKMIELRMLRIEHRIEIEKVLTYDQKKKWREHLHEMMKKHREHHSDN